jgi:hypothetical protein
MRASFTQRHLLSLFFLILLASGTVLAGPGDRNRDQERDKDNYTFSKIRQNAFGLRFGPTSGLVYTRYIGADQGLDLMLSFRNNGAQISGIYFKQQPLLSSYVTNLTWYGGGGGHIGWTKTYRREYTVIHNPSVPPQPGQEETIIIQRQLGQAAIGLDGVIGMAWNPWKFQSRFAWNPNPSWISSSAVASRASTST